MLLPDLLTYLAAQGAGTVGTDLFDTRLPDGVGALDRAAALIEYQGLAPEYVHDNLAPSYENPRVQLSVRAASYTVARTYAYQINGILAGISNLTLSGVRYLAVTPMSNPFLMRRDEKDRPIMACNYAVVKAPG